MRSASVYQQPGFSGLADSALPAGKRVHRVRHKRVYHPVTTSVPLARVNPIAQVVVLIGAMHFSQTFDYLVPDDMSDEAQPGVRVEVPFGARHVEGFIWKRVPAPSVARHTIRPLDRVVSPVHVLDADQRRDIDHIAHFFGGTTAQIISLSVPPRTSRVEKERSWNHQFGRPRLHIADQFRTEWTDLCAREQTDYSLEKLKTWIQAQPQLQSPSPLHETQGTRGTQKVHTPDGRAPEAIWDVAPGKGRWAQDMAWTILTALMAGKPVVAVVPGSRQIRALTQQLESFGLHRFGVQAVAAQAHVSHDENVSTNIKRNVSADTTHPNDKGDFAVLDSASTPSQRYRAFLGLSSGLVRCAIGTRAAMYAPVGPGAVFAVVDDNAYQNSDGDQPYANVRDVLQLRARLHSGIFVCMGLARSPQSQMDMTSATDATPILEIHATEEAFARLRPEGIWLTPENVRSRGDVTAGSRIPHTAVALMTQALKSGPVLVVAGLEGFIEVLGCARCHRQARCTRCTGPLRARPGEAPVCLWCGQPAVRWTCRWCGSHEMRPLRIGAQGTATQISHLMGTVPIVVSVPASPRFPRGPIDHVDSSARVVVATASAIPTVQSKEGPSGYSAVVILDAWSSRFTQRLDARTDVLGTWMAIGSSALPASQGGRLILIGDCDDDLAQSLIMWDPRIVAASELADRQSTFLPPTVAAATVWGTYDLVMRVIDEIGAADGGDLPRIHHPSSDKDADELPVPSVLGPIPIRLPETQRHAPVLKGASDRVRAIVRVPREDRQELADRLHTAVAQLIASRARGEIRFWIDPKDLVER